jgi:hypothetical protein
MRAVRLLLLTALAWSSLLVVPARAELPTIEQATDISQKTGRPILAFAGNET